ncbi:aluminum-activated malate transporter 1-like [Triticum dicoccoides]|uniref:aluminum-activated malate transporter 1-like n=1 Tax=Triticum dicoccoides TaxID=85692 RepID=UPI001890FB2C|nr:aluminum-activated malate transporter 1-like [Triticum dicoccoides]
MEMMMPWIKWKWREFFMQQETKRTCTHDCEDPDGHLERERRKMADERFSTIIIGVLTCLCTTIFVFPVWAGEDLHKLTAGNLDKLAQFLQGLESECFG